MVAALAVQLSVADSADQAQHALVVLRCDLASAVDDPRPEVVVTGDPIEFAMVRSELADAGMLAGSVRIFNAADAPAMAPPQSLIDEGSSICEPWIDVTILDPEMIEKWSEGAVTPEFLNEVRAPDGMPASEAALEMDLYTIEPVGDPLSALYKFKLRFRSSDGAVSFISSTVVGYVNSALCPGPRDDPERCGAGPWWRILRLCCYSQLGICEVIGQVTNGFLCGNCQPCFNNCLNCTGGNPCHSCDPCGLTWLLCHVVPWASCN